MVHALGEIRRVLVPKGILVDIRPLCDRWPVEVISRREARQTGRVDDLPLGLEDDEAANSAIREAESNGWFAQVGGEFFPIHYVWDTASDMEKWVDEEWEGFIGLDEGVKLATRSAWALGDADTSVRVRVKMMINKWMKV